MATKTEKDEFSRKLMKRRNGAAQKMCNFILSTVANDEYAHMVDAVCKRGVQAFEEDAEKVASGDRDQENLEAIQGRSSLGGNE